jgi:uncharacterized protein (TIGR04255 family)
MAEFQNLKNAPSVEAVLELRVRLSSPFTAEMGTSFTQQMQSTFPKADEIRFVSTHISFGNDGPAAPPPSVSQIGVRLESVDGKWVIQAKADGLALSRLAPYESWETLIAQLEAAWPVYVQTFAPQLVTRIGARFINKFSLGTGPVDLDDILFASPKIPPQLPQQFIQFSSNVVIPVPDLRAAVAITQASELVPFGPEMGMNVILDIDAFAEAPHEVNDPSLWEVLNVLRKLKNMAFFGSLKPETLARFQ